MSKLFQCFKLIIIVGINVVFTYGQTSYDIVIIGGSTSGVPASIAAARHGNTVLLLEESPWLGGMITSGGVSAFDGNHNLPSGIFNEFRNEIYNYYGGADKVETGWVSNTLFEPHIGNDVFNTMVKKYKNIDVFNNANISATNFKNEIWNISFIFQNKSYNVNATILIDATELGDIAAKYCTYDIGMESRMDTKESIAPLKANNIIQDLTYTAILKDYGKNITMEKPPGYDASIFKCCCDTSDPSSKQKGKIDCQKMLEYGKLPNNKYMINWPNCGNDIYLNTIKLTKEQRNKKLEEAKLHTLRFVYFLNTELGFANLDLADDEYGTKDKLPYIAYNRESRRIHGLARLTAPYISHPFDQQYTYYRTGIAVGDYPIDHHHKKNLKSPDIDFINLKVPSYNIPIGSLIPKESKKLIVAEKSISVSNIVNGTTRLQPVVMGIGQAAGMVADYCIKYKCNTHQVDIRAIQNSLLEDNVYLMPYIDVKPTEPSFKSIQKIGACGILKGYGIPYKWANQTWFYPEQLVSEYELVEGLRPYFKAYENYWAASGKILTLEKMTEVMKLVDKNISLKNIEHEWLNFALANPYSKEIKITRSTAAVLIDNYLDPFNISIDFNGFVIDKK